jgi:hypothetical protein
MDAASETVMVVPAPASLIVILRPLRPNDPVDDQATVVNEHRQSPELILVYHRLAAQARGRGRGQG